MFQTTLIGFSNKQTKNWIQYLFILARKKNIHQHENHTTTTTKNTIAANRFNGHLTGLDLTLMTTILIEWLEFLHLAYSKCGNAYKYFICPQYIYIYPKIPNEKKKVNHLCRLLCCVVLNWFSFFFKCLFFLATHTVTHYSSHWFLHHHQIGKKIRVRRKKNRKYPIDSFKRQQQQQ